METQQLDFWFCPDIPEWISVVNKKSLGPETGRDMMKSKGEGKRSPQESHKIVCGGKLVRNSLWEMVWELGKQRCLWVHLTLFPVLNFGVSNLHYPKPGVKVGYIDKINNNNKSLHLITCSLFTYLLNCYCMGYIIRETAANQKDQVSVFMKSIYSFPDDVKC